MVETIRVEKINEVHMRVVCDVGLRHELSDYFSFRPEGYQFVPSYKNKLWDGYIKLCPAYTGLLYVGLLGYLRKFCHDRGYKLDVPKSLVTNHKVDDDYGIQLAKMVGAPFEPRDYQNEYIVNAIKNDRATLKSPTGSGKSFIIYLLAKHYELTESARVLVIVPTISLVHQMAGDFVDYKCDPNKIYKIQGGVDKNTDKQIVITTWQSIAKQPKEWFEQFGVAFGDEAHLFAAKSLTGIMEKMVTVKYRFGLTGTLKGSKVHKLVLEGLFGSLHSYTSTAKLIKEGSLAELKINSLILTHTKEDKSKLAALKRKVAGAQKYAAEREFIIGHEKRNLYIRNLLWSLKGQNNLVLFDLVEKHGKILEPLLRKEGRTLHFIHGGIKGDAREEVRKIVEGSTNNDILASTGVFSTGVNIKRLDNLIFAYGSKSQVKVLQSIGRTLRKGGGADFATLYDLSDDLTYGGKPNYSLNHLKERISIYDDEQLAYKIYTIAL